MVNDIFSQRKSLFPITTRLRIDEGNTHLIIADCDVEQLADSFGTPLYIIDQATLDDALRQYHQALQDNYPTPSRLTYAGKAYLCLAIAQWASNRSLVIDCTGAGELAIASAANVPKSQLLVHGVNKSPDDLEAGIQQAGTIVVDNLYELDRLELIFRDRPNFFPKLWLRLRPGVAVETHTYTQTGQVGSKFGMSDEEIVIAVQRCLDSGMQLEGIHFHLGSHFHDLSPLTPAIDMTFSMLQKLSRQLGWYPTVISPGGGWGVPYHEDDLPYPTIDAYVKHLAREVIETCEKYNLPLPILQLEPGRSLIARAGVAIYKLGAKKSTPSNRWYLLDGGMTDNIRPALYGARYSALPVRNPQRADLLPVSLAGPYCESGDILIRALPMPDLQTGEYIAIPVSGAYQLSMGSNYNGSRKPVVLWLMDGVAKMIQRRESFEDLYRRDYPLDDINEKPRI